VCVSCDVPSWHLTKGSRRTSATSTARRQSTETDASVPSRALVYENRVHPTAMFFLLILLSYNVPYKKNQQFCGYPRIPHFQTDHYWVLLAVVVGNKHCSMLLFNVLQFVPETYFWTFLDMWWNVIISNSLLVCKIWCPNSTYLDTLW
jgi:hypothetical protein